MQWLNEKSNKKGEMMASFIRRLIYLVFPPRDTFVSGGRDLVAKYTHGNVKLQTGRYLTLEASRAMKERVRAYEF